MRTEPSKIESTRESESLKSVLLDAITHDFRSPLTSIKASVTGLLDDLEFDREQRRELLTIINEECDRINRLVGEAAEIARLESGEVKLDLASHSVGDLLSAALAECKSVAANREICVDVKHQGSRLLVDLLLAKRVLVHLITNANLYSSPGNPIRIATQVRGGFKILEFCSPKNKSGERRPFIIWKLAGAWKLDTVRNEERGKLLTLGLAYNNSSTDWVLDVIEHRFRSRKT